MPAEETRRKSGREEVKNRDTLQNASPPTVKVSLQLTVANVSFDIIFVMSIASHRSQFVVRPEVLLHSALQSGIGFLKRTKNYDNIWNFNRLN